MIDPAGGEARNLDRGRQIRFLVTPAGVRVAYATVGQGSALVVPAAWIGHLENSSATLLLTGAADRLT